MRSVETKEVFSHLQRMKEIIDSTMNTIISRHEKHPDYPFIDLKIDAISGIDHFNLEGIRDKNHIYSWIQGRGLEALVMHIRWYNRFSGYLNPSRKKLEHIAETVAAELMSKVEDHNGHVTFLLSDKPHDDTKFTMSDLFCSRGLYAYYTLNGPQEKAIKAKRYLKDVVHSILNGNFYNDQNGFDDSQYKKYEDGRRSYAAYMLALGSLYLLAQWEHDKEVPSLAEKLITYVLTHHVNRGGKWEALKENTIVEWIDERGDLAYEQDRTVSLDPGHALEWVGITSQLLLAIKRYYKIEKAFHRWSSQVVEQLPSLLEVNFNHGYRAPGGIVKSVDGISGKIISDSMPWWSLPEAMRAIVLVQQLDQSNATFTTWYKMCFEAFKKFYYDTSELGIAIQTIDTNGKAIAIIPATPDLDPGYHTGLSFLSCYDTLAQKSSLIYSGKELEVPVAVGSPLSGHAARSGPSVKILDSLSVRLCYLREPYGKVVLINADALEFSQEWIDSIRPKISEILRIDQLNILISATHTHTAPSAIRLGTLEPNEQFLHQLETTILRGCHNLEVKQESVFLENHSLDLQIGINRRVFDSKKKMSIMAPNKEGSRDDQIGVVVLRNEKQEVQSIWVNTAVHPTTLSTSMAVVSSDYPGRIIRSIKKQLGEDVLVIAFTGACGDVRPNIVTADQNNFREGGEQNIEQIGEKIAQEIVRVLQNRKVETPSKRKRVSIRLASREISLPYKKIPTKEELKALLSSNERRLEKAQLLQGELGEFERMHDNPLYTLQAEHKWATTLLEKEEIPSSVGADFSLLCINQDLYLFTIPGELFSSVGKRIKGLVDDSLVMIGGYTGGSLGYLPSESSQKEGGYEVVDAYKYYGFPSSFARHLERTIIDTMKSLINGVAYE